MRQAIAAALVVILVALAPAAFADTISFDVPVSRSGPAFSADIGVALPAFNASLGTLTSETLTSETLTMHGIFTPAENWCCGNGGLTTPIPVMLGAQGGRIAAVTGAASRPCRRRLRPPTRPGLTTTLRPACQRCFL